MNYVDKLKDPRWQQMRLKVFERDEWMCQCCLEKNITLNVHHLSYEKGKDPWEYPMENLLTVCEDCHCIDYENRKDSEEDLLRTLRLAKFWCDDLSLLSGYIIDKPESLKDIIEQHEWEYIELCLKNKKVKEKSEVLNG